jgi:hypothetical protein
VLDQLARLDKQLAALSKTLGPAAPHMPRLPPSIAPCEAIMNWIAAFLLARNIRQRRDAAGGAATAPASTGRGAQGRGPGQAVAAGPPARSGGLSPPSPTAEEEDRP